MEKKVILKRVIPTLYISQDKWLSSFQRDNIECTGHSVHIVHPNVHTA